MKIQFKDTTLDIGIIQPGSTVFVNFEYTGEYSDIVFIRQHCGCTGDHVNLSTSEQKILQFRFKESDTPYLTKVQIDNYYSNGYYSFTKQISVYLNDDQPLQVTNDKGEKDYNPNKSRIDLYFIGKVDITNFTPTQISVP